MRTHLPSILALALALVLPLTAAACRTTSRDEPADRAVPLSEEQTGTSDAATETGADAGSATTSEMTSDAAAATSDAVATVNGEAIPLADFQRQAFDTQRFYVDQGLDPNTEEGQQQLLYLRKQVLDDMVNQALIEQAAAAMGIAATDEEVAVRMQGYLDEFGDEEALAASLAESGTTLDEVTAMERASIISQKLTEEISADVPTTAEFVHARHILCATEADCAAALARLAAGEAFDEVAADVSTDDTSAKRGGDLDWIAPGMLPSQQLEEAIFNLQAGQQSGVVQTDFGFHIIEVLERDPQRELSAEQRYTLREKRLMEWLGEERAAADIVILVEDLRDLETAPLS